MIPPESSIQLSEQDSSLREIDHLCQAIYPCTGFRWEESLKSDEWDIQSCSSPLLHGNRCHLIRRNGIEHLSPRGAFKKWQLQGGSPS